MVVRMVLKFKKGLPILPAILSFLLFTACSSSNSGTSGNDPVPLEDPDSFVLELLTDDAAGRTELLQNARIMTSVFVKKKVLEGTAETIQPNSTAATAFSVFAQIVGLSLDLIKTRQAKDSLQKIDMMSEQIAELKDLVESQTNEIMNKIDAYIGAQARKDLELQANKILALNDKYLEVTACPGDPQKTTNQCADEAGLLADSIYWGDLTTCLKNINTLINNNAYKNISTGLFEAQMRGYTSDSQRMQKAARGAFATLSSFYFYISMVQQLGYQLMLETYNCLKTSGAIYTPQEYAKVIYAQTKKYWTEVERLNVFGFQSGYPAGGTRMEVAQPDDLTGWKTWVGRIIEDMGTEYDPELTGNQFFLQADLLAAVVNGFPQLAVVRSIFDPDAPTYRNLGALNDRWEEMKKTAPEFTLKKDAWTSFDSSQFEPSRVDLCTDLADKKYLKNMRLWRSVKKDIPCPNDAEWEDQSGGLKNTSKLLAVSTTPQYTAWAVGEKGTILYFDGLVWKERTPIGIEISSRLRGVSALDESHVWAVGSDGTILFFDGEKWRVQESGVTQSLVAVSALDESHVWAVGSDGMILFFDGEKWQVQESGVSFTFFSVSALDENHVWAVGSGGNKILFFDGEKWQVQESDVICGLLGVSAADENHVWAVGTNGVKLFFNGKDWKFAGREGYELSSVSALDKNHVWAVGQRGLMYFYDGGNWRQEPLPKSLQTPSLNFLAVQAYDQDNVVIVGEEGYASKIYFHGPPAICNQSWELSGNENQDIPRPSDYSIKAWGERAIAQDWRVGGGGIPDVYHGVYSLPYYAYLPECFTDLYHEDWVILKDPNDLSLRNERWSAYFLCPHEGRDFPQGRAAYALKTYTGLWLVPVAEYIYAGRDYYLKGCARSLDEKLQSMYYLANKEYNISGIKLEKERSNSCLYTFHNATPSNMIYLLNLNFYNGYPVYSKDRFFLYNKSASKILQIKEADPKNPRVAYLAMRKESQENAQNPLNVIGDEWTDRIWKIKKER